MKVAEHTVNLDTSKEIKILWCGSRHDAHLLIFADQLIENVIHFSMKSNDGEIDIVGTAEANSLSEENLEAVIDETIRIADSTYFQAVMDDRKKVISAGYKLQ